MAQVAGPTKQHVPEHLEIMKAQIAYAQANKLKSPSPAAGEKKEQCAGNIWAQAVLHNTLKTMGDRKLNKEVFTDVGRAVMGEVALTNFGPVLNENYQREVNLRKANKEVFTPDISRSVFEKKDESQAYVKHVNESLKAESIRQEGNKGAHNGDIHRSVFQKEPDQQQVYAKALLEKQRIFNQKQLGNKGAHNGDLSRTVFEKGPEHKGYDKHLIESSQLHSQRQLAHKGAHSGDLARKIFDEPSMAATSETNKSGSITTTTIKFPRKIPRTI